MRGKTTEQGWWTKQAAIAPNPLHMYIYISYQWPNRSLLGCRSCMTKTCSASLTLPRCCQTASAALWLRLRVPGPCHTSNTAAVQFPRLHELIRKWQRSGNIETNTGHAHAAKLKTYTKTNHNLNLIHRFQIHMAKKVKCMRRSILTDGSRIHTPT